MTTESNTESALIEKLIDQLVSNARQSGKIEERLDRLDDRVSHLETDVSQIKTDMGELKTDVGELKVVIVWLRWIGGGVLTIALALIANAISSYTKIGFKASSF